MEDYSNSEIIEKLTSGDQLTELIGMRDYLIHELTVNRCTVCLASKLRTGDTASLSKRLSDTLEAIEEVRSRKAIEKAAAAGEVEGVAAIRAGRGSTGGPETPNPSPTKFGSKSSPRRPSPKRRNARS